MRVAHNIPALQAWMNVRKTQSKMKTSIQRLSTGYRINSAADDAAGYAIVEKMMGQINGLNTAIQNSQNAISAIQTASGALDQTQSILQRMRELAVEAANDTNTTSDRQQIQKEVNQLIGQIDQIRNTTQFNTQVLLNGNLNYVDIAGNATVVNPSKTIKGASIVGSVPLTTTITVNTMVSGGGDTANVVEAYINGKLATVTTSAGTLDNPTVQLSGSNLVVDFGSGNKVNVALSGLAPDAVASDSTSNSLRLVDTGAIRLDEGVKRRDNTTVVSPNPINVNTTSVTGSVPTGTVITVKTMVSGSGNTANVVEAYVNGQLAQTSGTASSTNPVIQLGTVSNGTGTLTVDFGNGSKVNIDLTGLASDAVVSNSTSSSLQVVEEGSIRLDKGEATGESHTLSNPVVGTPTSNLVTPSASITVETIDTDNDGIANVVEAYVNGQLAQTSGTASPTNPVIQLGTVSNGTGTLTIDLGTGGSVTLNLTNLAGSATVTSSSSINPLNILGMRTFTASEITNFSNTTTPENPISAESITGSLSSEKDITVETIDTDSDGIANLVEAYVNGQLATATTSAGTLDNPTVQLSGSDLTIDFGSGNKVDVTLTGLAGSATVTSSSSIDPSNILGMGTLTVNGNSVISGPTNPTDPTGTKSGWVSSEKDITVETIDTDSDGNADAVEAYVNGQLAQTSGTASPTNPVIQLSGSDLTVDLGTGGSVTVNLTGLAGSATVTSSSSINPSDILGMGTFTASVSNVTSDFTTPTSPVVTVNGWVSSAKDIAVETIDNDDDGNADAVEAYYNGSTITEGTAGASSISNPTVELSGSDLIVNFGTGGSVTLGLTGLNPGGATVTTSPIDPSEILGMGKVHVDPPDPLYIKTAFADSNITSASISGFTSLNKIITVKSMVSGSGNTANIVEAYVDGTLATATTSAGTLDNPTVQLGTVSGGSATLTIDFGDDKVNIALSGLDPNAMVSNSTSSALQLVEMGKVDANLEVGQPKKNNDMIFQVGANQSQTIELGINDMGAKALGLETTFGMAGSVTDLGNGYYSAVNVTTKPGAQRAITLVDNAIQVVSTEASKLGAIQNRLTHITHNLQTASTDLTSAESTMKDVDMAKEMMEFSKQQILLQSSMAMLAQANSNPQQVLRLFR